MLYYNHQMNKECGTMVLFLLIILIMISVYWRPMQGIIRGLLLGLLFVFGGSFLNIPVPVSFVVFILYCQLGTPWLRKTNYRQTKATRTFHESTTTDADHSSYTTEQYYYSYEADGTDYTDMPSIYPYNKKLHTETKSAECEIFYHPKKPKKMFCPEDIAKDYYTIWILRFLIGGTLITTGFYF